MNVPLDGLRAPGSSSRWRSSPRAELHARRAARSGTRPPSRRGPGRRARRTTNEPLRDPAGRGDHDRPSRRSGWSSSTSTCRTVVVSSGGAETSASSRVDLRRASPSSPAARPRPRCARRERSSAKRRRARLEPLEQRGRRRSGSRGRSGTRPADVCGCVSSPSASSSASSLRTVDDETPHARPLDEALRARRAAPVATYSSTTRRRISRWRSRQLDRSMHRSAGQL